MNTVDIILIAVITAAAVLAAVFAVKRKKRGCGCGCEGCSNGQCKYKK